MKREINNTDDNIEQKKIKIFKERQNFSGLRKKRKMKTSYFEFVVQSYILVVNWVIIIIIFDTIITIHIGLTCE